MNLFQQFFTAQKEREETLMKEIQDLTSTVEGREAAARVTPTSSMEGMNNLRLPLPIPAHRT